MSLNSDLHCHPSLKPTYNPNYNERDMWSGFEAEEPNLNIALKAAIKSLSRHSQSNLDKCVDGNVRLIFIALYPFEIQFFDSKRTYPFRTIQKLILPNKKKAELAVTATGVNRRLVEEKIRVATRNTTQINYFKELQNEIETLKLNTKKRSQEHPDFSFHLSKDFEDLKTKLDDTKKIVAVTTIEGAHSLANYSVSTLKKDTLTQSEEERLLKSFTENITNLKKRPFEEIPFFITFCHHFNNQLAGHAPSLSDKSKLVGKLLFKPGMRHFFNQNPLRDKGITKLGYKVLDLLLSDENGPRILIDVKHMSVQSRIEYYNLLKIKYKNVPVINSHASVSGIETLEKAKCIKSDWETDKKSFVSKWSINLTDEDIIETYNSNGIIGLCLHEGRMPGDDFRKQKKKLNRKLKKSKNENCRQEIKGEISDLFMKLFWSNIFHIVKIQNRLENNSGSNDKSAWSGITIGSDYDGIVDAFDDIAELDDYNTLRDQMIDYIKKEKEIIDVKSQMNLDYNLITQLIQQNNCTIEDRIEQIMSKNLLDFMSNFYCFNYLSKQIKAEYI